MNGDSKKLLNNNNHKNFNASAHIQTK